MTSTTKYIAFFFIMKLYGKVSQKVGKAGEQGTNNKIIVFCGLKVFYAV